MYAPPNTLTVSRLYSLGHFYPVHKRSSRNEWLEKEVLKVSRESEWAMEPHLSCATKRKVVGGCLRQAGPRFSDLLKQKSFFFWPSERLLQTEIGFKERCSAFLLAVVLCSQSWFLSGKFHSSTFCTWYELCCTCTLPVSVLLTPLEDCSEGGIQRSDCCLYLACISDPCMSDHCGLCGQQEIPQAWQQKQNKKNHRDAFYLSSSASKEMEIEMLISHHEVLYVLQRLTLVNSPIIGWNQVNGWTQLYYICAVVLCCFDFCGDILRYRGRKVNKYCICLRGQSFF